VVLPVALDSQSWSIVVFCFNEEANLQGTLRNAEAFLEPLPENSKELIVVDDGSTDGSASVAMHFCHSRPWARLIRNEKNYGIGSALWAGYSAAQKENVCAVPGDGQFDLNELRPFRVSVGSRVIAFYRVRQEGYSSFRKLLSLGNKLINFVFLRLRLRDVNWVKIYKRVDLERARPVLRSSLIETEICAKLRSLGVEFTEVPSRYLPRNHGSAKGGSRVTIFRAIKEIPLLLRSVLRG